MCQRHHVYTVIVTVTLYYVILNLKTTSRLFLYNQLYNSSQFFFSRAFTTCKFLSVAMDVQNIYYFFTY